MFVFAFILGVMVFLLLKEKLRFIFYSPLLLQIADIIKVFIEEGSIYRIGVLIEFTIIITSLAVCLLIILNNIPTLKHNTYGIFLLLIYLLIMISFSTDVWWSLKRYMHVALTFLIFPAAFILVKNIDDIRKIGRIAIWLIIIFLINSAICTYLNVQIIHEDITAGYRGIFVKLGSVNFFNIYGFVYAIILIPLVHYLENDSFRRYLLLILYFIGLFALILILKRAYVYLAIAGALIFIFLITKRKNLRFIGVFFIVGIITYILLSDFILASISIRQEVLIRGYAEEGRGIELILYPEIVKYSRNSSSFMLFGEELFNSQGKFLLIEKVLHDRDRLLHSDIAIILYGSGLIGLLLFVRTYYFVLRKFLKVRKKLKMVTSDEMLNKLYASYLSIFICLVINTLSDGMLSALNRVLPYLILGAILGVLYKRANITSNEPLRN